MQFNETGKEIAPCIVSKARYALGIKCKRPINKKTCTKTYWENTILTVASNSVPTVSIENAIAKYDELILEKAT